MTHISRNQKNSAEIKTKNEEGKMKNKFMQKIVGTFLGLLMLIVGTQIFVSGQINLIPFDQRNPRSIQGTWRTVVTPRNCQTNDPVAPAFQGLLGFHEGGTLSGTSTVAPAVYGVWQRERGWHIDYSFAFTNFRYNASGVFIGTQTVRQTAELASGGNEFNSTGTVEVFDVNGNLVGSGCVTSTGTRFE